MKKLIVRQGKGFSSNINELNATVVPTVGFLSALSPPFLCICKKIGMGCMHVAIVVQFQSEMCFARCLWQTDLLETYHWTGVASCN